MLWTILLAAILIGLVWALLGKWNAHPLDKLPSPPRMPILGHVWTYATIRSNRDLFNTTREILKTYGDRVVIKILNRRILQLQHPDDVEEVDIMGNVAGRAQYVYVCVREDRIGTVIPFQMRCGVVTLEKYFKEQAVQLPATLAGNRPFIEYWNPGQKWHRRRKILTPTFHFNILKNFAPVLEEKSHNMVEMLKRTEGQEQELFRLVSDVTLYAICETAMGTQLDQDKSTATVEYKQSILDIGHLLMYRITKFWLHNEFIFKYFSGVNSKFEIALKNVQSFADDVILERKRQIIEGVEKSETDDFGGKKRLAMLDLLLEAESKGEIDLEGIREEVNTFMFEGHDTTATALTFGLMLLADHPDVQERIYEEIQAVLGDRTPTMTELAELKYLEAVIKEVLRLYPSVPFIARTVTDTFHLKPDVVVPKGSEVAVHIYDLHRRADLYPDPERFNPERFLDGNTRHPYGYVPFSAGPRNCIGQRFAMLEMKIILCAVCRSFVLEGRARGWRPALLADLVLRSDEPIYVKFIART